MQVQLHKSQLQQHLQHGRQPDFVLQQTGLAEPRKVFQPDFLDDGRGDTKRAETQGVPAIVAPQQGEVLLVGLFTLLLLVFRGL